MFAHGGGKYPMTIRNHDTLCLHGKQALERENAALRAELKRQWEYNHAEHCGKPQPHEGECYWPMPPVLGGSQ